MPQDEVEPRRTLTVRTEYVIQVADRVNNSRWIDVIFKDDTHRQDSRIAVEKARKLARDNSTNWRIFRVVRRTISDEVFQEF